MLISLPAIIRRGILTALTASLFTALPSHADDETALLRPVQSIYTLGVGSSHLADTYLSPIKYSGWDISFGYERNQAMKFSPEKWVMQMRLGIEGSRSVNMAGNAYLWYAGIDFSWGMMRRWRLPYGLSAGIGGSASLDLGCLYLDRTSNNPASAKAAITVNATGYIAWNGKLRSLPVTLRYQPTLPVTGVFFAPDYGELYYEIYLGNHSGLAHCAWWSNYFRLDNLVTADLHFGSTSLRIGYSGNIFSSKVNDVVTRIFTHTAVVGVSGEWISLNPRKRISPAAKTISATY